MRLSENEVKRRFDRPDLMPLWAALKERFEDGGPVSRVSVGPLDSEQRAALADLLGDRKEPGEYTRVSIERLDRILLEATGHMVRAVVEIVAGRIACNRAEQRLGEREARERLWLWLAEHPVVRAEPALEPWVVKVRGAGVIDGSVERTRAVLAMALQILSALPADGRPLPVFAQRMCGDTKALDDDKRLAMLVLRALAALHDQPEPADAEQRRRLWELAGIACDDVSTLVLAAGLQLLGDSPLARSSRVWTEVGQAGAITLAQLRHTPSPSAKRKTVWVVENPSVLAEVVAEFRVQCPPIVCVSGWPNSAAILLLRKLSQAGCELRYHGDFDGDGLRIAAYVMARTGAVPWRMSCADYLAAAPDSGPEAGRVTDAPWDADLAAALRDRRVAVYEEAVVADLLSDLR